MRYPIYSVMLCVLIFASSSFAKGWTFFLDSANKHTLDFTADPYYSAMGYGTKVDSTEPTVLDVTAEEGVLGYLVKNFLSPKDLRIELSMNPFPVLGAYLNDYQNKTYQKFQVNPDLNIIQSISVGFPDPGALSLFLGNKVYIGDYETGELKGIGYGGTLLNVGTYHIVNNNFIPDKWGELELKIKGSALTKNLEYSWSFRAGAKVHGNKEIKNSLFLSLKRDRVDRDYFGWSIFKNSEIEIRGDFNMIDLKNLRLKDAPTQIALLGGKKFPTKSGKYVFSLGLGVLSVIGDGYSGALLSGDKVKKGTTVLIRPNIIF